MTVQGRAAYNHPWQSLADIDRLVYGEPNPALSRRQVVTDYARMAEIEMPDLHTRTLVKPLQHLFSGMPNGKLWRREVEEALKANKHMTLRDLLDASLHHLSDEVLDAPPGAVPLGEGFGPAGGSETPTRSQ